MDVKTINNYVLDNNELDLEQIIEDYSNYIYIIIRNMTSNLLHEEDIEELISDVLFVVWKNKEKIEKGLDLKPYIAGITKNVVKNRLRSIKLTDTLIEENVIVDIDLDDTLYTREQMRIINNGLNKMGKKDKDIFTLFYCYGMKSREIAGMLNMTESNVNTKLHRIKKKLIKILGKGGIEYEK